GWDHIGLEVDVGQDAPQGPHGGCLREGREIGADISVGEAREFLQVDVLRQGHAARVDLEDLQPAVPVRDADLDLAVEPAGPAQRRIERVRAVRGPNYDDLTARLEA